jgi:hypothetical protein
MRRALGKASRWIRAMLAPGSGKASKGPATVLAPATGGSRGTPPLATPVTVSPEVKSPPGCPPERRAPDLSTERLQVDSGPFEPLQRLIRECCQRVRSVEWEMQDTSQAYRDCMPPARLQLFPWTYPRGSPPNALCWVRLFKKQDGLEGGHPISKKRPRWWKRYKIRTRRDLHSAIYKNGLSEHSNRIMGFFDRTKALNVSRRSLGRAMGHSKRSLKTCWIPVPFREEPPGHFYMTPFFDQLDPRETGLYGLAWSLRRAIEKIHLGYERLLKSPTGVPWRLFCDRITDLKWEVLWEHSLTGERRQLLDRRFMEKLRGSVETQGIGVLESMEHDRRFLAKALSKSLDRLVRVEGLLANSKRVAEEALGSCPPVRGTMGSAHRLPRPMKVNSRLAIGRGGSDRP